MIYRILEPADAAAFKDLRLRGLQDAPYAFGASYEDELAQPLEILCKRITTQYKENGSFILGAWTDEGLLAGVIGLRRNPGVKLAHKAFIWGMYVSPQYRGKRIGKELVIRTIKRAKSLGGLEHITLNVTVGNDAAIHLYRACGFEEFAREPRALRIDEDYYDQINMICVL